MDKEQKPAEAFADALHVQGYDSGLCQIVGGRFDGEDLLVCDLAVWDGAKNDTVRLVFSERDAAKFGESLVKLCGP